MASSADRSQEKVHKSKRASSGADAEIKEERKSSERSQRGESIASNSSHGSTGAASHKMSPGREANDRGEWRKLKWFFFYH